MDIRPAVTSPGASLWAGEQSARAKIVIFAALPPLSAAFPAAPDLKRYAIPPRTRRLKIFAGAIVFFGLRPASPLDGAPMSACNFTPSQCHIDLAALRRNFAAWAIPAQLCR